MSAKCQGFTLFELLIAMLLTAIIGAVMFNTWDMVIRSGATAQKTVADREKERVVFGIMDNDFSAMLFPGDETANLPTLSKKHMGLNEEFNKLIGRKTNNELDKGANILMSFATASSLKAEGIAPDFPVCVEYSLRSEKNGERGLIRRERDFCGVKGEFPWMETLLFSNLLEAGLELVFSNGERLSLWTDEDLAAKPVAVRFYWRKAGEKGEEMLFPLFGRRQEIGWEDK